MHTYFTGHRKAHALYTYTQAVRIFRKKSAEGLSSSMYSLETVGIGMSLAFSIRHAFPFSTYGESFFILIQNFAIMAGMYVCVFSG
jgi:mannose-P-dolichol utilization defect protein 1